MKTLLLTLCTFAFLIASSNAQYVSEKRTYRVTAFQAGNLNILSQSNYAEVVPEMRIFVPNTFTPNNDGLNDTFGARGEGIGLYDMQIFDRWGNPIFHSSNPNQQWDGTYHKEKAPEGAYVYKIIARGVYEGAKNFDGTVTLIR
ncbi:MAG: gliding motility-associated C-terminal domain-containing protein [Bacteroidia bacterium]|nr:gliding motility-associated C-terminal domain-containing protein [Bacteroidia bacterium]